MSGLPGSAEMEKVLNMVFPHSLISTLFPVPRALAEGIHLVDRYYSNMFATNRCIAPNSYIATEPSGEGAEYGDYADFEGLHPFKRRCHGVTR